MKTEAEIMKEYNLNQNQASVVIDDSKELIVQAGAGSGKTTTLVCKIVNLLKEGKSLDSFLVLTFTNKAAYEMKDRIKKQLSLIGLNELANKVDSSNISTFDSFAYNFVKQNSALIGLDSNIEILEKATLDIVTKEILEDVILNIMSNKESFSELYRFLELFTDDTSEKDLIEKLTKMYEEICKIGKISEIKNSELILKDGLFNSSYFESIIEKIDDIIPRFSEGSKHSANFEAILEYLKYLNRETENKPGSINLSNMKWKSMGIDSNSPQAKEITGLYAPFKKLYEANLSRDDLNPYFEVSKKLLDNILEILNLYAKQLLEFKTKTNKYEFSDIARFLIQILEENPNILERQKQITKYIFVDEYQDTSKIQLEFLDLLITNNNDVKVLYVGDIKQCIYKFRDAVPESFIKKQAEVKNIILNINYRSLEDIVSFTNNLFGKILSNKEKYDIDYLGDQHSMDSGVVSNKNTANVYLEEVFTKDGKKDDIEEAFTVGEKIKKLKETSKIKKYSDVTILSRDTTKFDIFEKVFNFLDIPLQFLTEQKLKTTYLLKLISNILKLSLVIYTVPKRCTDEARFYYYSIARSELYERSDYDLFHDVIDSTNFERKLEINEDILEKCKLLNKYIKTKSNYAIIDETIKLFDIYNKISKTLNLQEKEYQIEYLYELASRLDDLGKVGVDFVEYIYNLSYDNEIEPKINILLNKEEDSVKMLNIHQAKGLEYDTLFLVGLNQKFIPPKFGKLDFDKISKFTVDLKRYEEDEKSNIINDYVKEFKKDLIMKDNLKEELRLLYVAITRAKNALYIVTTPKDDYSKLNCFTDYLYENGLHALIENKNITKYKNSLKNDKYYQKQKGLNRYYPKELELLEKVDLNIQPKIKDKKRASMPISKLTTKKEKRNISQGVKMHLDFEYQNLENPLVKRFYETKFNNKDLNMAKKFFEYEFIYEEKDKQVKGIIDLIAIYDDEVHIIDYKLKDVDKEKYKDQLLSYKKYLSEIFDLDIKLYLYSILDEKVNQIE